MDFKEIATLVVITIVAIWFFFDALNTDKTNKTSKKKDNENKEK